MFGHHPRRSAVVAAGVLSLALIAACSAPGQKDSASSDTKGPIKIALVDAQSGQLSSLGAWELKGAKLAVDEWNKAGGINGRQIQLDVFDDQGDPTVGTNLARKIASEGYVAMIGTAESAVTIAMAPILKQARDPEHHLRPVARPGRRQEPVPVPQRPDQHHVRRDAGQVHRGHQGHQEHRDDHQQRLVRQGRARRVPQGAGQARASRRSPTRWSRPTRRTSAPRSPRSGRRTRK